MPPGGKLPPLAKLTGGADGPAWKRGPTGGAAQQRSRDLAWPFFGGPVTAHSRNAGPAGRRTGLSGPEGTEALPGPHGAVRRGVNPASRDS